MASSSSRAPSSSILNAAVAAYDSSAAQSQNLTSESDVQDDFVAHPVDPTLAYEGESVKSHLSQEEQDQAPAGGLLNNPFRGIFTPGGTPMPATLNVGRPSFLPPPASSGSDASPYGPIKSRVSHQHSSPSYPVQTSSTKKDEDDEDEELKRNKMIEDEARALQQLVQQRLAATAARKLRSE